MEDEILNGSIERELKQLKQDKMMCDIELENEKTRFAKKMVNIGELDLAPQTVRLRKKFSVRWKEFIDKIRYVFG